MPKTLLHRSALTLLLLTSASQLPALGQADPIKFGKPDLADFDAKNFIADSAAEAVVLCDFGRTRFETGSGDFKLVFERVTRIKILKKSGYDWATVKVPLYKKGSNEEKISALRGFTYNMVNGQLVKEKMASDATFMEQQTTNNFIRKFTLPNVREGSVIEYTYTVNSDFLFNFQDWQFQYYIPVRWSEYRAAIPEYFDYKQLFQGYEPLAVQERNEGITQFSFSQGGSFIEGASASWGSNARIGPSSTTVTPRVTNYRWAMKQVPGFRDEPFMTTSKDYVARVDFELAGVQWPGQAYESVAGSWQKIDDELLNHESLGSQLKRGGFLKAELAAITAQHSDPAARAVAVHAMVRKAVKHNGTDWMLSTGSLKHIYDQHTGNSADVNLMLIAALRDAGLEANPVVLSTRSHGRLTETMPLMSSFNYVVAHVALPGNQELMADATDALLPFGMLPTRCLSGTGRLLMPGTGKSRWVSLTPTQRYVNYHQVHLTMDERGGMKGKVHQENGGYAALDQRENLVKKGEKKFMEDMAKTHEGWTIPTYAFKERETLHKPLTLDYEFTAPGADAPAPTLYLNLLRHFSAERNPFVHEERRFPVDFAAPFDETVQLNITLPAGYEPEEMPKPTAVKLPEDGGVFTYQAAASTGSIQIMSRMTLRRAVYSAEEYTYLREFYSRMLAKHAEQIVLKKKS
ncbi:DUF3857 domain-containing protein [Hymenobacter sp. BT188]|uniref:DUF3857 domain-containing protein n=1 Tax=Hymenobacter sp. BT188 TaxID=2763504 RepID=UPI001650DAB2|nr:DUF3857 domain-containing protein [Hymenobacter sp. BT188]MBC6607123.1 DUF3857 domain-containing protein [Hymenobacter sp. BT188]